MVIYPNYSVPDATDPVQHFLVKWMPIDAVIYFYQPNANQIGVKLIQENTVIRNQL